MEAEKLNTSVVKEYDLKKGETVVFHVAEYARGHIGLSVTEKGKDPVFTCDDLNLGYYKYEIQNDGHYLIEVSGSKMTGNIEVDIK